MSHECPTMQKKASKARKTPSLKAMPSRSLIEARIAVRHPIESSGGKRVARDKTLVGKVVLPYAPSSLTAKQIRSTIVKLRSDISRDFAQRKG